MVTKPTILTIDEMIIFKTFWSEQNCMINITGMCFILQLTMIWFRNIITIFDISGIITVRTVLASKYQKWSFGTLTVGNIIARNVITLLNTQWIMDCFVLDIFCSYIYSVLICFRRFWWYVFYFFLIFFFGIRSIINYIVLISEIVTSKTIRASYTIITKRTMITVLTLIQICTSYYLQNISAKITLLTVLNIQTIYTIFGINTKMRTIQQVFIISTVCTHITIFVVHGVIGIFRILTFHIHKCRSGCMRMYSIELCKKWLRRMIILPKGSPIIIIRPPLFCIPNRQLFVRRIHGNDFLVSCVTGSYIKLSFISPC